MNLCSDSEGGSRGPPSFPRGRSQGAREWDRSPDRSESSQGVPPGGYGQRLPIADVDVPTPRVELQRAVLVQEPAHRGHVELLPLVLIAGMGRNSDGSYPAGGGVDAMLMMFLLHLQCIGQALSSIDPDHRRGRR